MFKCHCRLHQPAGLWCRPTRNADEGTYLQQAPLEKKMESDLGCSDPGCSFEGMVEAFIFDHRCCHGQEPLTATA